MRAMHSRQYGIFKSFVLLLSPNARPGSLD
jgi:hypothetical protein